jgi:hypothetical protein
MGTREPMRGGSEYDYLTRARRFFRKKAGKFTQIKAAFWQRTRKMYRLKTDAETRSKDALE